MSYWTQYNVIYYLCAATGSLINCKANVIHILTLILNYLNFLRAENWNPLKVSENKRLTYSQIPKIQIPVAQNTQNTKQKNTVVT